jgi:hypothetical protein
MRISAFLTVLVFAAISWAQSTPTPSDGELTQILPGILIPTELSKSLDAKKAKAGDPVEVKITMDLISHGKVVIPRNSKIVGHVTSAKPHTKDAPDSELGIAFDRLLIKGGKELPLQAEIQAMAPPLIVGLDPPAPAGVGPGLPGQQSANVGSGDAPGTAMSSAPQIPSMTGPSPEVVRPGGALTSESRGAVGMKGVAVKGNRDANLITSSTQNVHLDGGMQLMLKTQ